MWIPWTSQITDSIAGYDILNKTGICYLAGEERTGKLLTSVLIAERCETVNTVLVLTTKKALGGWNEMEENYTPSKDFTVTNYHQAHKLNGNYDLVILDECHNYLTTFPKTPGPIWKAVRKLTNKKPIVYTTATPYPQGVGQLYHQFALSNHSPWKHIKNGYAWFNEYGISNTAYIYQKEVEQYNMFDEARVLACVEKYFIKRTRKESGFEQEPEDMLHYVELAEATRNTYNMLLKDSYVEFRDGDEIIADTPGSLRANLHQIEGGGCKIIEFKKKQNGEPTKMSVPKVLSNTEKIDYILETWGDADNLAIMYNYHSEGEKLPNYFKNALILQATSYAEGVDLSHIDDLVIYSQDFRTSKFVQRRARQANKDRQKPIIVNFILVKNAVSEQVYNTVALNKTNFVDKFFERNIL